MDVIKRHPLQFEGGVGAKGGAISVGQRQRLGLARAIARKPDLLVLGEFVSSEAISVSLRKSFLFTADVERGDLIPSGNYNLCHSPALKYG